MTISGDDVMEVSLLRPVEEESGPSPTPEEEASLMGEGDGSLGAPGSDHLQVEISRFIEPAKWTTTPVTSTALHCYPSLKREQSWEGIDVNPNNTSQWVCTYLKKDSQFPEWWEEFWPLTHSAWGWCNEAQAKNMAHQQTVLFCLSATHKKVHGTWLAPTYLAQLKRKEYLGPKDPWLTWDYQEVWKEETIMLAIVLQQCAIWAGVPPDAFCGEVKELQECLVPVVEEGNFFNMEKEIWEGVMKDPMVATTSGAPIQEQYTIADAWSGGA